MKMNATAQRVWDMSNEYVKIAIEHLSAPGVKVQDQSPAPAFDARPEALRIQFLFPEVSEEFSKLLFDIRQARLCLRTGQQSAWAKSSTREARGPEQQEAMHAENSQKIRRGLAGFSVVQQEILQVEFMNTEGDS